MAKAKSSKNKDDKKKAKSLKSLDSDQLQSSMPANKSLNSLKKIQKQLDSIVTQREAKNKQIKELKKKTIELDEQTTALNRQTTALSQQTKNLSKQAQKSESQLSKYALNKDLQRINTALNKKNSQFDQQIDQLSKEIDLFKDLARRVEHKIQTLETRSPAAEESPSATQLQSLNKKNKLLFKKVTDFEEKLNQFSDTFILPEEATAEFSEQLNLLSQTISQLSENYQEHDTQIKLLKTDNANIRKSLQRDIESQNQALEIHQHGMNKLEQTVTGLKQNIGEQQQEFNSHQQNFESHQQDFKSHQQDLKNKMDQFNEQLKQSQDELKQQLQFLNKPEQDIDLEQFKKFNDTLDYLSLQLSDVTEQSGNLQNLFSDLQEQQNTDSAHHDELSKQYLSQQQQLEKHEGQLIQLLPVIFQSDTNEPQLQQISDSQEQSALSAEQLSQLENDLQSGLLTLDHKIDENHDQFQRNIEQLANQQQNIENFQLDIKNLQQAMKSLQDNTNIRQGNIESHQQDIESHQQDIESHQRVVESHQLDIESHQRVVESHQRDINSHQREMQSQQLDMENHQLKMVSYQQDQSASLNQLSQLLKTRSQLFTLGLISVLAISTILLFNQDIFNQIAAKNTADRQELIAQIKTDVTNDTFTQINALNKQNSSIISQQFNQVRDSIKEVRKQTELITKSSPEISVQALQSDWQEQHQVLQDGLSSTQKEQQGLNKTVVQLSEKISTVSNQFQQLQKSMVQNSAIAPKNQRPDIEITDIEKIKSPFYTIQLLGAQHQESIRSFIRQHQLSDSNRIYQTEYQDKAWYILVQGHYSSFSQAKEKLQQLPEFLQKNDPWIKKLP